MLFAANKRLAMELSNPLRIAYGIRFRHVLPHIAGAVRDLLVCTISGFKLALLFALMVAIFS